MTVTKDTLIGDIAPKISHWPTPVRGLLYGSAIMVGEYVSGSVLTKFDVCPWSYKGAKYAVNDIVLIVLWVMASIYAVKYISVVVCFSAFFVNDIYGFISWRKMKFRQSQGC